MPAPILHIDSCKRLFDQFKLRRHSLQFALVTIGSVLTDLEEMGVVSGLHWKGEAFLQYLLRTDPKYAPIAIGMIMHEELDKTIDRHYVEPNTKHAERILKKYNGHSFEGEGHYFLDHVMTCAFAEAEPRTVLIAEQAKKRLKDRHVVKIAYHLATFFGGKENEVITALHHFKAFDLNVYLSREDTARMYGQFSILRDAFNPAKRSWMDKIKLAARYVHFLLSNKQTLIRHATEHAKGKFKNHKREYALACKAMGRRFAKLNATYNLSIK